MRRSMLPLLACLLIASASGCAKSSRVYGTVKFQGKPLTYGAVVFMAANNQNYPADIRPDGTFEVHGVPYGPTRVVVQLPAPRPASRPQPANRKDAGGKAEAKRDDTAKMSRMPAPPEGGPAIPKNQSLIPPHYGQPDSSGLSLEISLEDTEYNIEL